MTSPVQVEHRPGLVRVVLDRPSSGNALDLGLVRALTIELERAEADPGVRVLTLTGRERFFCAGGDVAMISSVRAPADRGGGRGLGPGRRQRADRRVRAAAA